MGMRKLVEVDDDGLESYLGKTITLFCMNYIYEGELTGVNDTCVQLKEAEVVYETGPFTDSKRKDAQRIVGTWYVQTAAIESFGKIG